MNEIRKARGHRGFFGKCEFSLGHVGFAVLVVCPRRGVH